MSVASPCIGACWIDEATGWCCGCGRTRDEIAEWLTASDARKRDIRAELPARLRANAKTETRAPHAGAPREP